MTVKTWTDDEIDTLIANEIRDAMADATRARTLYPTPAELAPLIRAALDERGLIERTP